MAHSYDENTLRNLMNQTEQQLNRVVKSGLLGKKTTSSELEKIVYDAMRQVSKEVGVCQSDIRLVSGQKFPDIVVGENLGVEVKSTQGDHWTSTGSSIIETTKVKGIEYIYLFFCKLGGEIEFKCRPYDECQSGIVITHCPRYSIDMNLSGDNNIFTKLGTPYDKFQKLNEQDKIKLTRAYYKNLSKGNKTVMPWWIGESEEDASPITIGFFKDLPQKEQSILRAKMLVLFPELLKQGGSSKYKRAVLWLCAKHSVVCHNVRDLFSAGGKTDILGWRTPQVIEIVCEHINYISKYLKKPDDALRQDILEFWDIEASNNISIAKWIEIVQTETDDFDGYGENRHKIKESLENLLYNPQLATELITNYDKRKR